MNSRSAHLTLTTSPISTKSGTWMIAPVSKVASLDWPVEAAAPSGRVAAALGGFGCGALLVAMVAMASRKRGAVSGYEAV